MVSGNWTVSDGLVDNSGIFSWSQGTGSLSRADHTGIVSFPGTIHFTGHDGQLDLTFSNLRVRFDGGTKGTLILDAKSLNMGGELVVLTDTEFATLDLSGVRPGRVGGRTAVTVTDAPVTLTAAGSQAFAGFYKENAELDPISFTIPLEVATERFTDVKADDQFYKEINWLAEKGITTGWPDQTFRPLNNIERGAVAAFFYRLAGSPEYTAPETSPFADVSTGHQFYKEIAWMAEQKITTGWADGTFRPDQPVNRDAMAAFFYRYAGSPAYEAPAQSSFVDIKAGDQFYKEISWLAAQGISQGWSDQTFRPVTSIKRDAMAAFIYRYEHRAQ